MSAVPQLESLLAKLSEQMHMQLVHKETLCVDVPLVEAEEANFAMRLVPQLSEDLHVHRGSSADRVYLLNFKNFLPADIPRPESCDMLTHCARPELLSLLQARRVARREEERAGTSNGYGYGGELEGVGEKAGNLVSASAVQFLSKNAHVNVDAGKRGLIS